METGRSGRARDHLANERTLLAWIRTSISIVVFGFVLAKAGVALRQTFERSHPGVPPSTDASLYLGTAFIVVGVVAIFASWLHYARTRVAIERGEFRSAAPAIAVLSCVVALFGNALLGYLLFTPAVP